MVSTGGCGGEGEQETGRGCAAHIWCLLSSWQIWRQITPLSETPTAPTSTADAGSVPRIVQRSPGVVSGNSPNKKTRGQVEGSSHVQNAMVENQSFILLLHTHTQGIPFEYQVGMHDRQEWGWTRAGPHHEPSAHCELNSFRAANRGCYEESANARDTYSSSHDMIE